MWCTETEGILGEVINVVYRIIGILAETTNMRYQIRRILI